MNDNPDLTRLSLSEDALSDAEVELKRSRAALRNRILPPPPPNTPADSLSDAGAIIRSATPVAESWVRAHPLASLTAAAATGMVLMRWKPWRGLGSSLVAGFLVRQAMSFAAKSRGRALDWLLNTAFSPKMGKPRDIPTKVPR
jgi:ElaB/YqjD/DUF883 family membrane-anchored ribosome-binding protein